ncbi:hypothetical protein NL676_025991 [Syzygium grande]|nr:hypothetical protein NL676_025991 [Syzygium grande]
MAEIDGASVTQDSRGATTATAATATAKKTTRRRRRKRGGGVFIYIHGRGGGRHWGPPPLTRFVFLCTGFYTNDAFRNPDDGRASQPANQPRFDSFPLGPSWRGRRPGVVTRTGAGTGSVRDR